MAKNKPIQETIPEVTYCGSQNYSRFDTPNKNTYEFTIENDFTVQPETWADFYAILSLDGNSIARNYLCRLDPMSNESYRRVSSIEREEVLVPQEVYDNQAEIDLEYAKKARLEYFKNEYQRKIAHGIQTGTLEFLPETLEDDAIAYANEAVIKEEEFLEADKKAQEDLAETKKLEEQNDTTEPITNDDVIVTDSKITDEESTTIVDTVTESLDETKTEPEVTGADIILQDPVVTVDPTVDPTVEPTVEPTVKENVNTSKK